MSDLDVRIRHGGGGVNSTVIYVVLGIAIIAVLGASASAVSNALMMLFIWVASIMGGVLVLGALLWFFTRGIRAQHRQDFEDFRAARDESYHRQRLEMVQAKARIKAQETASMAVIIAQAIQAGQQQPQCPDISHAPPTYRAEVLKSKDSGNDQA